MLKLKKTVSYMTTGLVLGATTVATIVSCGSKKHVIILDENKITGRIQAKDVHADWKGINLGMVTDTGKVTDLSFNQSGFEIANIFAKDIGVRSKAVEPADVSGLGDAYKKAAQNGAKVLVLPGFHHNEPAQNSLPADAHGIIIDGSNPAGQGLKRIAALQYSVEQPAIRAGYAAGVYLNAIGDKDPKIGSFLGYIAEGIANFSLGFLIGAAEYNKRNEAAIKAGTKFAVKFAGETFPAGTTFKAGAGIAPSKTLLSNGADIIMPVAGAQTADLIKSIKTLGSSSLVIGVDVDQSKAYTNATDKFFTSIEKKMGQSVYDVLKWTYTHSKAEVNDTTTQGNYYGKKTTKGLSDNWVGLSETKVPKSDIAKKAFKEAETALPASTMPTLVDNYAHQLEQWTTKGGFIAFKKAHPAGNVASINAILKTKGSLTLGIEELYNLFTK